MLRRFALPLALLVLAYGLWASADFKEIAAGIALFMFGLASIFYPPLKLLIGSMTTSAAICAGGLALMVLPTLVVGNELLILGGVASAVALWFLAHRHGRLRGFVDANRNGVEDRVEGVQAGHRVGS